MSIGGSYMPSDTLKFTLRTESALLKKLRYIAEYNARSANRELEVIVKQHISTFENTYGEINDSMLEEIER